MLQTIAPNQSFSFSNGRPGSNGLTTRHLATRKTVSMNPNHNQLQFGTFIAGLHKIKTSHLVLFMVGAVVTSPIWVPIYAFSAAKEYIQGNRKLKNDLAKTNNETVRHGILKEAITSHKEIGIGAIKRSLNHLNLIEDTTLKASLLFLALNAVGYKAPKDRTKIYKLVEKLLKTLPEGEIRQKLTIITDGRLGKNNPSNTAIDSYQNAKACEASLTQTFGNLIQPNQAE
jgi:hypothetical protein